MWCSVLVDYLAICAVQMNLGVEDDVFAVLRTCPFFSHQQLLPANSKGAGTGGRRACRVARERLLDS